MILLDGERYGLTVPRHAPYRELAQKVQNREFWVPSNKRDWWEKTILTYEAIKAGPDFGRFHVMDSLGGLLGYMENGEDNEPQLIFSNAVGPIGWRPVLVPLKADGHTIDNKALASMPNGTVTHGGSLYLNGEPIDPDRDRLIDEQQQLTIGDTVDEDRCLSWLVCNGRLICTEIPFFVEKSMSHLSKLVGWLDDWREVVL